MIKYLPVLSLLFACNCFANLGATVEGETINWPDSGGWMQVQSEITLETIDGCEGFITTCTVVEGVYKLIDHDSGIVQNGIRSLASTETLIERATCNFSSNFVYQGDCEVSCPGEMRIKRLVACAATINESGLLKPTDFDSNSTTLFCRTSSITVPTTMMAGVECE